MMDGWVRSGHEEGVFRPSMGRLRTPASGLVHAGGSMAWRVRQGRTCVLGAVQGEAIPGTRKTTHTSLQVCPEKDQRPLVHTGAKSQKDQGEVACSCLDSWCRVCVCACVCVCIVWAYSHASDCTETQP